MNRRTFLSISTLSSIPFLLPYTKSIAEETKDKACIFIFLSGGISSTEFINPIPTAPPEFKSVNGHITTDSGYLLGGTFTNLAKVSNLITPVLSFCHKDGNHSSATGWMMSGKQMLGASEGSPQKEPSYGSIISKMFGQMTHNGVPTYVKANNIQYDDAAWLGSSHIGYEVTGEGAKNLRLNMTKEQLDTRMAMVNALDRHDDNLYREWAGLRSQAYNIMVGKASKAFKIDDEPLDVIQKYNANKSLFGKSLLVARRAIQYGSKFVTINNGGWDMHQQIEAGFNERGPDLDHGLYTLISDLQSNSLLEKTLVVITSEFSRTPKINKDGGRDHWPGLVPLILSGGQFEHGRAIGTTNNKAEYPTSSPYSPTDLTATIFKHFGIDNDVKVVDNAQRPRYFVEGENVRCIL